MSDTGITCTHDGIRASLEGMLDRTHTISAFLARVTYPEYVAAQEQRWMTENASEGDTWRPLTPGYAAYKKKRYAGSPGNGDKLMIRTGALSQAATGRGAGMNKLITDNAFVVTIDQGVIPYAAYAAEQRSIMHFADETVNAWKQEIADYITKGTERG